MLQHNQNVVTNEITQFNKTTQRKDQNYKLGVGLK